MNTLSVNLHLLMVSFFQPTARRFKIVIEKNAFPSDRYAVISQLAFHNIDPADGLIELDAGTSMSRELARVLDTAGHQVALIMLPGVQYLTGEVADMAAICRLAATHGCRVGFDLAHAIGNVPLQLHRWGADFAVWCSYKYLNGGPGAVGGAFVNERWANAALPRFAGWWGHDKQSRFGTAAKFRPLPGAEGWQLSNPPILSLAPLLASLQLFNKTGLVQLRNKSQRLTEFLEHSLRAELGDRVRVLTPRAAARRGCQLSVRLQLGGASPEQFLANLEQQGLVVDWRAPDVLRLAPVPLYNRFADVFHAVKILNRSLS
jgi:kynureninase